MSAATNAYMTIRDYPVKVVKINDQDYISLTDIAKSYGSDRVIDNWLRNKNTLEFLGVWEHFNNTDFNYHEFEVIKASAGLNRFTISVKEWVSSTKAVGLIARTGRYGGSYAHKDIAFEFGSWLSPEFKLLIITEFQRLKTAEEVVGEWDSRRYLSKVNYRLQTDAIKKYLVPELKLSSVKDFTYTTEADMLNKIVFGQSANQWRQSSKAFGSQRNQRDFASTEQLLLLANLEALNSHLISEKKTYVERFNILIKEAVRQYESLININTKPSKKIE